MQEENDNPKKQHTKAHILMSGLRIGESPRWHDGRLWFSNWGGQEIIAVDPQGKSEVIVHLPFSSFPFSFDWLPDGHLLIVSTSERPLLRQEEDGTLVDYGDLSSSSVKTWNELVVDSRGNAYINGSSFNPLTGEEFIPGIITLVTPDGIARQVADDIAFPNGMVITPDNSTLIIAESYANRLTAFDIAADGSLANRRLWADLGIGVPDGLCLDSEGAIWYADVPNKSCVHVLEGGKVLQTVTFDRGCFACALGGLDKQTLYVMATEWLGMENATNAQPGGQVLTITIPAPDAYR